MKPICYFVTMPPKLRLSAIEDQAEPQALARAIRQALRQCPIKNIFPILGWEKSPTHTQISGILRITMVLEGLRHIRLPTATGIKVQALAQGEMIVVAPSGWSTPRAREAHRVLHIDCFPTFTRFTLKSSASAQSQKADGTFHSNGSTLPTARALQQALIHITESVDEKRILPIVQCFIQEVLLECRAWESSPSGLHDWQSAVSIMHDHSDIELRRDVIATAAGIHPNHLSRLCKKFTEHSLTDYICTLRMQRACSYLRNKHISIADVAELSGYHDHTHFRKRFKMIYGHTPSTWRILHKTI